MPKNKNKDTSKNDFSFSEGPQPEQLHSQMSDALLRKMGVEKEINDLADRMWGLETAWMWLADRLKNRPPNEKKLKREGD